MFEIRSTVAFKIAKSLYNYWQPKELDISQFLERFNATHSKIFFIQVGSNDGVSGDPIYRFIQNESSQWRGILIEPVPYLFEKLKMNYLTESIRLIFENIAIDSNKGSRTLYRISETPQTSTLWFEQIASFDRNMLEKHRRFIPDFDKRVIEETVMTDTFENLLRKHTVEKIDLVHIDTEGYDFEIIKMIGRKNMPNVLLFEHKHLTRHDYRHCCKYLRKLEYSLYKQGGDTLAIRVIPQLLTLVHANSSSGD